MSRSTPGPLLHELRQRLSRLAALAFLTAGALPAMPCAAQGPALTVERLETPTADGSRVPSLAPGPGGGFLLTWVEPLSEGPAEGDDARHALRLARAPALPSPATGSEASAGDAARDDGAPTSIEWGAPVTVASGAGWFVNWADFPAAASLADGTIFAHWLVRYPSSDLPYAYYVYFALSPDGGATWGAPRRLHDDRSPVEHGFVSAIALDTRRFGIVWLDGRAMAPPEEEEEGAAAHEGAPAHGHGEGATAVYFRTLDRDGRLGEEVPLDDRACDCCQTTLALVDGVGPLVSYRDRGADERRDIAITRPRRGHWDAPLAPTPDGWTIAACPVNGPTLAANGARVGLAWYTEGELTERAARPLVRVALSIDAGDTFRTLEPVDDGQPLGRVSAAMLADGTLVVSWLERVAGGAEWRVRAYDARGIRGPSTTVAATRPRRDAGFARLTAAPDGALIAWTDLEADRVLTARVACAP